MLLFDVWEGLELVLVHLRNLFFGQLFLFMCMYGDFEIFWGVLLGGSCPGSDLDLELREYSDLALSFLNALYQCPITVHSSFGRQSILRKSEKRLKVRFSNSKMVKIRHFPKLGHRPPGGARLDFFDWKVLGCRCFDVWEWLDCFVGHSETPSSVFMNLSMLSMAILTFLVETTGSEASGRSPGHFC